MTERTTERLTCNGQAIDAVLVSEVQTIDGEKVHREYVEVYPAGRTDDPEAMIGWCGSVEGFTRIYSGATRRNF